MGQLIKVTGTDRPVLRQQSVLVRQAVLTPKFSKDEEKDEKDNLVNEIEIKDESASPEKGKGVSRTRTDSVEIHDTLK